MKCFLILKIDAEDLLHKDSGFAVDNAALEALFSNAGLNRKKYTEDELKNIAVSELDDAVSLLAAGLYRSGVSVRLLDKKGVLDYLNNTLCRELAPVQNIDLMDRAGVFSTVPASVSVDLFLTKEVLEEMAVREDSILGEEADCDVAIHITGSDEQKVMWLLSRKIAGLEADLINESRSIKIKELKDQLADLHAQEERLRKSIEKLYSVSIQAAISSDSLDSLKKFSNRMIKRMANQGVFLRSADTKQLQSLFAITPLDNVKKDLRYTFKSMETSNIADMFPFKDGTISHTTGYLIGEDFLGKPIYYDDRHPLIQNYNSVTFGIAGSGKSMKTKILHSRKLLAGTMTTIIDYEKENKDWILKLGFPYIEFMASGSKHCMNVFPIPRIIVGREGERNCDIDDAVNTVSAIVFKMIRIVTEKPLNGNKKILIKEAIQKCYSDCGITYEEESVYKDHNVMDSGSFTLERQYKPMPQLMDLYEHVKTVPELKEEVTVIKSFTKAGNIKSQSVFDCQSNFDLKESLLVGISVADLDEIMRPIGLYVSTTNSWSTYERMPRCCHGKI